MATVQLVLNKVQMSLSSLLEPNEYEGKRRYKATFFIEKGSQNDKKLWAAVSEAAKAEWGAKGEQKIEDFRPGKTQFPIKDGDRGDFEPAHGCWVLTGIRQIQSGVPDLRDENNKRVTRHNVLNDGDYVDVDVDIWTQTGKNEGMRCALVGVRKVESGPSFGGARKVSSFASLETDDDEV